MRDGLWRVDYKGICAGFVVKNGVIVRYAPVLRNRLAWWQTIAVWVAP